MSGLSKHHVTKENSCCEYHPKPWAEQSCKDLRPCTCDTRTCSAPMHFFSTPTHPGNDKCCRKRLLQEFSPCYCCMQRKHTDIKELSLYRSDLDSPHILIEAWNRLSLHWWSHTDTCQNYSSHSRRGDAWSQNKGSLCWIFQGQTVKKVGLFARWKWNISLS